MTPRSSSAMPSNYFPQDDVPILDIDFADEYYDEPDGIDDFTHRLQAEAVDQH